MKSCSSNSGAAYSRPVRALLGTARKLVLGKRRGGLVGLCVSVRRSVLVLCAYLCFAGAARGSESPAPSAHPQTPAAQAGSSETSPSESKTPEQTKSEQYTLPHERQAKAVAYSRAGYTLYFASYFLGGLFLFLILRLGWAAKFRDIAEKVSDKKWIQGLIFVPLLFLTRDVLDLPLRLVWHSLSLHYEQSIQGWGSWFWDWTKEESLSTAFGIVLVLILFAVMRRSPRRWWLYFWFPAVVILVGLIVVTPWVIDPLFNKFEPLSREHADLVASIEKLTKHAGVPIPAERMFLMVASHKTNAINAYVTGLGTSKRVVIWDTTIQKTSTDESLFIVGHELGHYVLGHVGQGLLLGAAGLVVALYFLFQGLHWALDRWARDWKLYGQEDWASLAVLLLLLQLLLFVSSPVISGCSRMQEHAADVYGLEVIHGLVPNSEEVAAHAFQVLGELDLSDPNPPPFITFWLYSHPPLAERLVFAHTYDPWSKGESPKYVK
ncbi:MAG: peptidase M48 [Acidobacteria bacterium]|nr:MAG: peptidase M48 [Acidobacteriota bacterium]